MLCCTAYSYAENYADILEPMQFLSVQQLQQFQLNSVKSKQCSSMYD